MRVILEREPRKESAIQCPCFPSLVQACNPLIPCRPSFPLILLPANGGSAQESQSQSCSLSLCRSLGDKSERGQEKRRNRLLPGKRREKERKQRRERALAVVFLSLVPDSLAAGSPLLQQKVDSGERREQAIPHSLPHTHTYTRTDRHTNVHSGR